MQLGRLPGFQMWQTRPNETNLTQLLEDQPTWKSPDGDVELVRLRRHGGRDTVVACFFEYGIKPPMV